MDETQLRLDCSIDPDALDIEWLEQPNLFLQYAEAQAHARLEMDRAKEYSDLVKAQVDTEIRRSSTGESKRLTEAQVNNLVLQDARYRDAVDKHLTAKHNFEVISARVRALDQRKTSLENLVRLHSQQYFAGPFTPRDIRQEYSNKQQKNVDKEAAQNKVRDRINSRISSE